MNFYEFDLPPPLGRAAQADRVSATLKKVFKDTKAHEPRRHNFFFLQEFLRPKIEIIISDLSKVLIAFSL